METGQVRLIANTIIKCTTLIAHAIIISSVRSYSLGDKSSYIDSYKPEILKR